MAQNHDEAYADQANIYLRGFDAERRGRREGSSSSRSPDSVRVTKGNLCLSLERNILSEMMKTKTLAGLASFLVLFPPCFISSGNSWNPLSASHSPLQPTYPSPMASSIKNPSNVICDDISQKLSSDLMPKFIRVRV